MKPQTDSEDESDVIITSHKTSTDNATTQQTKAGNVLFEVSTNTYCSKVNEILGF